MHIASPSMFSATADLYSALILFVVVCNTMASSCSLFFAEMVRCNQLTKTICNRYIFNLGIASFVSQHFHFNVCNACLCIEYIYLLLFWSPSHQWSGVFGHFVSIKLDGLSIGAQKIHSNDDEKYAETVAVSWNGHHLYGFANIYQGLNLFSF